MVDIKNSICVRKFFTLIEILIVVSILAILAAFAVPKFQDYATEAKEATAKSNLHLLRNAIELYTSQHNGTPPGFPDGNRSRSANPLAFEGQLTGMSDIIGITGDFEGVSAEYDYGPYLSDMPKNPFNNKTDTLMMAKNNDFPDEATDSHGWVYQIISRKIKINSPGTDKSGTDYYNY